MGKLLLWHAYGKVTAKIAYLFRFTTIEFSRQQYCIEKNRWGSYPILWKPPYAWDIILEKSVVTTVESSISISVCSVHNGEGIFWPLNWSTSVLYTAFSLLNYYVHSSKLLDIVDGHAMALHAPGGKLPRVKRLQTGVRETITQYWLCGEVALYHCSFLL